VFERGVGGGKEAGDNRDGELHTDLLFVLVALNEVEERKRSRRRWRAFVDFFAFLKGVEEEEKRPATTLMESFL